MYISKVDIYALVFTVASGAAVGQEKKRLKKLAASMQESMFKTTGKLEGQSCAQPVCASQRETFLLARGWGLGTRLEFDQDAVLYY